MGGLKAVERMGLKLFSRVVYVYIDISLWGINLRYNHQRAKFAFQDSCSCIRPWPFLYG